MDGQAAYVILQSKHTGPFVEIRIIFNGNRGRDTGDNFSDQDSVRRQFVIAMIGYPDFSLGDKFLNLPQRTAHAIILIGHTRIDKSRVA